MSNAGKSFTEILNFEGYIKDMGFEMWVPVFRNCELRDWGIGPGLENP